MQVKSDIIQDVINRAKTAVRNFGENAQVELPAELVESSFLKEGDREMLKKGKGRRNKCQKGLKSESMP